MQSLGLVEMHRPALSSNGVELIPRTQQEINDQADAALQELFPRIPHTDRGEIIDHAFRKVDSTLPICQITSVTIFCRGRPPKTARPLSASSRGCRCPAAFN